MKQELMYYDELDSTNAELKRLTDKGLATEGAVVIAGMQTAGRGRSGRVWHSPNNGNLYMSILVKVDFDMDKASMITLLMAYAVANVLEEQGIEVQIKWPNDLVISGKKVCGILTELHNTAGLGNYLIVGVGLNLSRESLPKELDNLATGLCAETDIRAEKDGLAREIADYFGELCEQFREKQSLAFIQEKYNKLLVNRNRQVRVMDPKGEYSGVASGITADGKLLVEKDDGEKVLVYAGEVSVRGIYGYV